MNRKSRSETGAKNLATARSVAEQDKAKITSQQAVATQTMAALTAAETESARLTQLVNGKDSAQGVELTQKLDVATKQVADTRAANEAAQKALAELKAASDKSTSVVAAAEAETAKLKVSSDANEKTWQAAKDGVAQLRPQKPLRPRLRERKPKRFRPLWPSPTRP